MDASAPKLAHQEGYQQPGPCRSSRSGLIGFHDQEHYRCDTLETKHWWLAQSTWPLGCISVLGGRWTILDTRDSEPHPRTKLPSPRDPVAFNGGGPQSLRIALPFSSPTPPPVVILSPPSTLAGSEREPKTLLAGAPGQLTPAAAAMQAEQPPTEGCSPACARNRRGSASPCLEAGSHTANKEGILPS